MPCSICRQTGHNRSTCSRRTNITGLLNNPPGPPPGPPPQNNSVITPPQNNSVITPPQNNSAINGLETRRITLVNMRDEKYLVYWVIGNYMVEDLDSQENRIKFMGLLNIKGCIKLKTMNGHRFYLIPHRLDNSVPTLHPRTDKQFLIEPYHQLNIHDEIKDKIFIDNKEELSELNKWKFNALKLDYLVREVIRFGGKDNDTLSMILDLHEDIELDKVSESEKDIAGIPSTMTNIT